ncbi:MAG: hypothetical protein Q9174_001777 [Haloplaca sp. 1 TL-2023]
MEDDNRISITVCGDGGCGKSSITLRFIRSQFNHEYDPTIEDSYSVTRIIDGQPYYLSLTDTAGQEEYRGLWAASNLRSDAFLLVYDITTASSLETLDYFLSMIDMECEHRQDSGLVQPVRLIAGNKCDLKDSRVVSSRQGLEYARAKGCGFMETSAREMVNIEETFARSRFANPYKTNSPMMAQSQLAPPNEKSAFEDITGDRAKKKSFWAKLKCW